MKKEEKKCKGIKESAKNKINFSDYKNTLITGEQMRIEANKISNKNHNLYSETTNKIALCAKDDKRFILPDGIHTLALFHDDIKKYDLKI